jgi:exosortase
MKTVGGITLPSSLLTQKRLALATKAAVIVWATVTVFFQDLAVIFNNALQNEMTSYVLAIPVVLAYLIYRKRNMLQAVISNEGSHQPKKWPFSAIAGILLLLTAVMLYWHGSYTFIPLYYHTVALPIFVAGLVFVFFNPQTVRQLAFPIAFLVLLTPPPSEILYTLGSTLSVVSSKASYFFISSIGIPSTLATEYYNPTIQITRWNGATISFAVDVACSGIYSLIGFLVFAVFIAYIIRDKTWKKCSLFVVGFPLFYILNIVRIILILLIGYQFGEENALELFHLLGGWFLIFIGTLLLLLFADKILHTQIFSKAKQDPASCNSNFGITQNFEYTCDRIRKSSSIRFQRSDFVKILTIVISVILLGSIQAPIFALVEGPAQIIIQTPQGEQGNTQILPQIDGYTLIFAYRDENFEEIAGQDASLMYAYHPDDKTEQVVWVGVEIGSANSMLHNWEVCLISWPIEQGVPAYAEQIALNDIQVQGNPPIIGRYFAFKWVATNQTQAVFYWFETANFMENGTTQQKTVKISLINLPATQQDIMAAEKFLPLATAIVEHWEPIKTWTQPAILLSENGAYLSGVTTILLAAVVVLYIIKKRKQIKANTNAYQKLSEPTKQIIDIVLETQRTTTPTLSAIAATYKNKTGKTIEKEELFNRISEIEKMEIIERHVANSQDEPIRIWKAQVFS